jgi:hypothetical protein
MMYKVPRPSRSNGVKIHTIGDHEIGIEYTIGEPHVGKMAYDSSCGIMSRNISFRRPDIEKIVADAVRQVDREDAMPKAGINRSMDMKSDSNLEYDDDASKVLSTLVDYLEKYLDPDQIDAVTQILSSGDGETDADRIGEKSDPVGDRRGRRPGAYGADDRTLRRRPMSAVTEDAYLRLFPNSGRLA